MNNLFMPKEIGNLDDLLTKKRRFVDADANGESVFVFTDELNIFIKKDWFSKEVVWKSRGSLGLCYYDGVLYESTVDDLIVNALNDRVICDRGVRFVSLCGHDGVLYGGTNKGEIYSINPWKRVYKNKTTGCVAGLASFENRLYHSNDCDSFETFQGNYLGTMEYDCNYMLPWENKLYWLSTEGVYNPFTEESVMLEDLDLYCGFVWDGVPHAIDSEGGCWDMTQELRVGKFADRVYDVAVVPKHLMENFFDKDE